MRYRIKQILKEELSKREIDSLLSLIKSRDIKKYNFYGVNRLLNEYGYSLTEIREIYLIYLNDSYYPVDDLTTLENYIESLYGSIDSNFDEVDGTENFTTSEDVTVFYLEIYRDRYGSGGYTSMVIPRYFLDNLESIFLEKDREDIYNTLKEYFRNNFGVLPDQITTSVSVG